MLRYDENKSPLENLINATEFGGGKEYAKIELMKALISIQSDIDVEIKKLQKERSFNKKAEITSRIARMQRMKSESIMLLKERYGVDLMAEKIMQQVSQNNGSENASNPYKKYTTKEILILILKGICWAILLSPILIWFSFLFLIVCLIFRPLYILFCAIVLYVMYSFGVYTLPLNFEYGVILGHVILYVICVIPYVWESVTDKIEERNLHIKFYDEITPRYNDERDIHNVILEIKNDNSKILDINYKRNKYNQHFYL